MENKRNPIKSYNTEAFVPEGKANLGGEELASNQPAAEMNNNFTQNLATDANDGNFVYNSAPGLENASQTRPEAPQAPPTPSPDTISTLNTKSLESPTNGLRTQNRDFGPNMAQPTGLVQNPAQNANSTDSSNPANPINSVTSNAGFANSAANKHKKRAKGITIIAVLATALILGIGVAVAWLIIDNGSKQPEPNPNPPASATPDNPDGEEVVELDINDELVQRLYQPFTVVTNSHFQLPLCGDDTSDDTREQCLRSGKLTVAFLNTPEILCKATIENNGLIERYGDFIVSSWGDEQRKDVEKCTDGAAVRNQYEKLFGEKIELVGFDNFEVQGVQDSIFTYSYSPTYDEFYYNLGGASLPTSYKRILSRAERDAEKVYLYEQIHPFACWSDNEENICQVNGLESGEELVRWKSDEILDGGSDDKIFLEKVGTDENMVKWTFAKTPEGGYVFEKLEKIEE